MFKIIIVLLSAFTLYSCSTSKQKVQKIGDSCVVIFDTTQIYFNPQLKKESVNLEEDTLLRLDAGRVVVKKIQLPKYELETQAFLNLSLVSNGDPWDKSGSFFILPSISDFNLIDFEQGTINLKEVGQDYPAVTAFNWNNKHYSPPIELMRFMTPFGVGHFSKDERCLQQKPIYLPTYDTIVNWSSNVTHLLSLLEHEVYVGVYIDTWTKEGYQISADITFKEFPYSLPEAQLKKTSVIPLVNTVKYASDQLNFDGFFEDSLYVDFELDTSLSNAKLYYTTTGHGGHASGDEFTENINLVYLDNHLIKSWLPWKDDCYKYRGLNPSSGVWYDTVRYKGEIIEERIASSDFSRSNWCPGSNVQPTIIDLGLLKPGKHQLKIKIPTAQEASKNEDNYWMVSAYIVGD